MDPNALVSSMKKGDKICLFNVANRVELAGNPQTPAEAKRILFTQSPKSAATFLGATFYNGYKFDDEYFGSDGNHDLVLSKFDVCRVCFFSNAAEINRFEIMNSVKDQKFTLTLSQQPMFKDLEGSNKTKTELIIPTVAIVFPGGKILSLSGIVRGNTASVEANFKIKNLNNIFQNHAKVYAAEVK